MKSVLISIQPKWCELIARGKKTVEVRKKRPKLETPFKCYIYCTKGRYKRLVKDTPTGKIVVSSKVIGEFVCDKIEEFVVGSLACDEVEKAACISYKEICDYFYGNNYDNTVRIGYSWHISDLKIYDMPREIGEFRKPCNINANCAYCEQAEFNGGNCNGRTTRPPQSWCYVEEN